LSAQAVREEVGREGGREGGSDGARKKEREERREGTTHARLISDRLYSTLPPSLPSSQLEAKGWFPPAFASLLFPFLAALQAPDVTADDRVYAVCAR